MTDRVTTPAMRFRTVEIDKVPGVKAVELPANTWTTIGLDGWLWTDDVTGKERVVEWAEVRYRQALGYWDAVLVTEWQEEIADAHDTTMHGALRKAADELGDSLTIREEWK